MWSVVPLERQVRVLVFEHQNVSIYFVKHPEAGEILELMVQRGLVWDKNALDENVQNAYLETVDLYISKNMQARILTNDLLKKLDEWIGIADYAGAAEGGRG